MTTSPRWPLAIRQAIADQDAIGWGGLLLGFSAKSWEEAQRSHFVAIRTRRSARRWIAALLKKLWDVSWDLWSFRNYQLHSGPDKEALQALQALTACINLLHARGPKRLPREFRSFVTEPLYKIHATSLADRLSWLDTVDAANRLGRQRTWFNPIRLVIDKFYRGGIIRRLQRSRKPPALRTTARAIQKTLLAITREDDPDDCQLPLPQTSF